MMYESIEFRRVDAWMCDMCKYPAVFAYEKIEDGELTGELEYRCDNHKKQGGTDNE